MKYIKIESNPNGSHDNQFGPVYPGEGWAVIPEEMIIPQSFPFVDIEVENTAVVSMVEKEIPVTPKDPSTEEITLLTLADHEERLCMIELGVNE